MTYLRWEYFYAISKPWRHLCNLDQLRSDKRRRKVLFGEQLRDNDDISEIYPPTLAELKRRGYGGAG
jgi:hypothetical protein